jgi:hypothetical protein
VSFSASDRNGILVLVFAYRVRSSVEEKSKARPGGRLGGRQEKRHEKSFRLFPKTEYAVICRDERVPAKEARQ